MKWRILYLLTDFNQYISNYFRQYYSTFQDAFGYPWRGVWWVSLWLGVWTGWWTMLQRSRRLWWPTTVNMYTTSSTNMQLDSSSVNYSIWSSPSVRWYLVVFWCRMKWSYINFLSDFCDPCFSELSIFWLWIFGLPILQVRNVCMCITCVWLVNFSYFSLDSETRSLRETFNPMCEVFPNVRNSKIYWFSFIIL